MTARAVPLLTAEMCEKFLRNEDSACTSEFEDAVQAIADRSARVVLSRPVEGERERFEAWRQRNNGTRWEAWQARAALAQALPPAPPDDAVLRVLQLASELCDSIDADDEDIGGHRSSTTIVGDLGPAVDAANAALKERQP